MICTGFSYDSPIKSTDTTDYAQRKQDWANTYDTIAQASSVLIVGGGIVGTELAAELACKYGEKKEKRIGMCIRGDKLLPGEDPRASAYAEQFLKSKGVEIKFRTPFVEGETPKTLGYDYVIKCFGYKYKSDFLK